MAEVASGRTRRARELFAPLGPTYDRYARLLSLGQDPRWRRFLVSRVEAGPGDRVLDVATGTGLVAAELIRQRGCTVVGLDQSPEMLAVARERLPDVELVEASAEGLPFADDSFDALTFTYLLRYVQDPGATLPDLPLHALAPELRRDRRLPRSAPERRPAHPDRPRLLPRARRRSACARRAERPAAADADSHRNARHSRRRLARGRVRDRGRGRLRARSLAARVRRLWRLHRPRLQPRALRRALPQLVLARDCLGRLPDPSRLFPDGRPYHL